MTRTHLVCLFVVTWVGGVFFFWYMINLPKHVKVFKRLVKSEGSWFWIDLFGIERTKENVAKFFRIVGYIGLVGWLAIVVTIIFLADWPSIFAMDELQ